MVLKKSNLSRAAGFPTRSSACSSMKRFGVSGNIPHSQVTNSWISCWSGWERSTSVGGGGVPPRSISGGVLEVDVDAPEVVSSMLRSSRTRNFTFWRYLLFCRAIFEASGRWAEKLKGPYKWCSEISIFSTADDVTLDDGAVAVEVVARARFGSRSRSEICKTN